MRELFEDFFNDPHLRTIAGWLAIGGGITLGLYLSSKAFTTGWIAADLPWLKAEVLVPFERNAEGFWMGVVSFFKWVFGAVSYFWRTRGDGPFWFAFSFIGTWVTLLLFCFLTPIAASYTVGIVRTYAATLRVAKVAGGKVAEDSKAAIREAAAQKVMALAHAIQARGLPPVQQVAGLAAPTATPAAAPAQPPVSMTAEAAWKVLGVNPQHGAVYAQQDLRRVYNALQAQLTGMEAATLQGAWLAVCKQRGWAA